MAHNKKYSQIYFTIALSVFSMTTFGFPADSDQSSSPSALVNNGIDQLRNNMIQSFQALANLTIKPKGKIYKKAAELLKNKNTSVPLFMATDTLCSHFLVMDALLPVIENTTSKSFEPIILNAQSFHKKLKLNVSDCAIKTNFDLSALANLIVVSLDVFMNEGVSVDELSLLSGFKTALGNILGKMDQPNEERHRLLTQLMDSYASSQKIIERFLTNEIYQGVALSVVQSMAKIQNLLDREIENLRPDFDLMGNEDLEASEMDFQISAKLIEAAAFFEPISNLKTYSFAYNDVNFDFVKINSGSFMMGSPRDEKDRYEDEDQHPVTISKDFYLSKFETTQAQWFAVTGKNPSYFKDQKYCPSDFVQKNGVPLCPNFPVENVSWDEVKEFIDKLNTLGKGTFRLPTEAEWEYAARAGTTTAFNLGDNISADKVNFNGNFPYNNAPTGIFREQPVVVGSLKNMNRWGLFDMHGNVWEWTADWYDKNYSHYLLQLILKVLLRALAA